MRDGGTEPERTPAPVASFPWTGWWKTLMSPNEVCAHRNRHERAFAGTGSERGRPESSVGLRLSVLERGVVGVAMVVAAVERGPLGGVEGFVAGQAGGQVGVGEEQSTEGDDVGGAVLDQTQLFPAGEGAWGGGVEDECAVELFAQVERDVPVGPSKMCR